MARKAQAVFRDESLANLRPREPIYGEAKKRRELMATDEGWAGLKGLAAAHGLSASEFVERLGRGTLTLDNARGDEPAKESAPVSIRELGVSPRVVDLLDRAKIETVDDLNLLSADDLLEIRGVGAAAQKEVIEKCGQYLRHPA